MRILTDLHSHTAYSFDCQADAEAMCLSAIEKGISYFAITDHCDVDCIAAGIYDEYDYRAARETVLSLKEKYAKRIRILYGIEIGGANVCPKESEALVKECGFDFVLGSVHNLYRVPDFYFMRYELMSRPVIDDLMRRMIEAQGELCELPFIHSLAHITYPLRYIARSGRKDIKSMDYAEDYERLFKRLIASGKSLEVNSSTLRNGGTFTLPDAPLLSLYRQCGGERITVGSDAHIPEDVGTKITDTYDMLKSLGFSAIDVYVEGKRKALPLH